MTTVSGQVVVLVPLIEFCWSIISWLQVLFLASSSIYRTQYQRPFIFYYILLWRRSSFDIIRSDAASNLSKEFLRLSFITTKKSRIFLVKLNGKNYFSWQFQTHLHLRGTILMVQHQDLLSQKNPMTQPN